MQNFLDPRALAFSLLAPLVAVAPAMLPARTTVLAPAAIVALQAHADPSLGALRAGGVNAPAAFDAQERLVLEAAQARSHALAALRAGAEPTNNEWKWLAIGAGIVLLVILI